MNVIYFPCLTTSVFLFKQQQYVSPSCCDHVNKVPIKPEHKFPHRSFAVCGLEHAQEPAWRRDGALMAG